MITNRQRLADAESQLWQAPEPGGFGESEIESLPEAVRRHLRAAIAAGAPLARTARLRMRGRIKVNRWLPFRADQVLSPRRGFFWAARAGGVISGWDRYVDGAGAMQWTVAGLLPVVRGSGPDVTRSAAGRLGGEAIWLPTALLPRYGVRWSVDGPEQVSVHHRLGDLPLTVAYQLDRVGRITSLAFDRWGDPEGTGTWGWHRFGGEVSDHRTFGGLTVPCAGRVGWFFGTNRWPDGEFFRFQITDLRTRPEP